MSPEHPATVHASHREPEGPQSVGYAATRISSRSTADTSRCNPVLIDKRAEGRGARCTRTHVMRALSRSVAARQSGN